MSIGSSIRLSGGKLNRVKGRGLVVDLCEADTQVQFTSGDVVSWGDDRTLFRVKSVEMVGGAFKSRAVALVVSKIQEEEEVPHRIKGFMQTYTGREYHFNELRPDQIDSEDIAHSLSNVCRFNGHCSSFYSVAQHSALVAYILAYDMGKPELSLWGLLHDASEAYVGDMLWGLKHDSDSKVGEEFRKVEDRIQVAIAEKFKLPWPMPGEIKLADKLALSVETTVLMGGRVAEICRQVGVPEWATKMKKGESFSMIPREAYRLFAAWQAILTVDEGRGAWKLYSCPLFLRPW